MYQNFSAERGHGNHSSSKLSLYWAGARVPLMQVACLNFKLVEPGFVPLVAQVPTDVPILPLEGQWVWRLSKLISISSWSVDFPLKEKWARKPNQSHPSDKTQETLWGKSDCDSVVSFRGQGEPQLLRCPHVLTCPKTTVFWKAGGAMVQAGSWGVMGWRQIQQLPCQLRLLLCPLSLSFSPGKWDGWGSSAVPRGSKRKNVHKVLTVHGMHQIKPSNCPCLTIYDPQKCQFCIELTKLSKCYYWCCCGWWHIWNQKDMSLTSVMIAWLFLSFGKICLKSVYAKLKGDLGRDSGPHESFGLSFISSSVKWWLKSAPYHGSGRLTDSSLGGAREATDM